LCYQIDKEETAYWQPILAKIKEKKVHVSKDRMDVDPVVASSSTPTVTTPEV